MTGTRASWRGPTPRAARTYGRTAVAATLALAPALAVGLGCALGAPGRPAGDAVAVMSLAPLGLALEVDGTPAMALGDGGTVGLTFDTADAERDIVFGPQVAAPYPESAELGPDVAIEFLTTTTPAAPDAATASARLEGTLTAHGRRWDVVCTEVRDAAAGEPDAKWCFPVLGTVRPLP